ncbi:MAG: class I SAM-dependent methyltransferase, partial [Salinisphaeraceae bacterium]|nr:class I SAM-dependent methyltransferase [Salinisphaeraceae bacterium]
MMAKQKGKAMKKTTRFWNLIANHYAKQPVADQASYERKLEITRDYLKPDMSVFEFGCGTGSTAIAHAPYVKQILATDISPKMIDIAQSKAEAAGVNNINFVCAAIDDYDIADASQDVVMAHSILHLVENKQAIIQRVHQILKPDGLFITSTACIGDMGWGYKLMGLLMPIGAALGVLPMVKVFTEQELTNTITEAG